MMSKSQPVYWEQLVTHLNSLHVVVNFIIIILEVVMVKVVGEWGKEEVRGLINTDYLKEILCPM